MLVIIIRMGGDCGNVMNETETIIRDTDKIVKSYGKNNSYTELSGKEKLSWLENESSIGYFVVTEMTPEDLALEISFKPRNVDGRAKPDEVYAIFDCWLKLKEKDIAVSAVVCKYSFGGYFDYDSWLIIVPYNEFENLYNKCDVINKSSESIAYELGNLWMYCHCYNRSGLKLDEKDKYRDLLITYWQPAQISEDKNMTARYDYASNKLSVDKIKRHDNISTAATVWSIQLDEPGYLYAAWDKDNNIWVFGEKNGLQVLKYDGAEGWNAGKTGKEDEAPIAIQKAMLYAF